MSFSGGSSFIPEDIQNLYEIHNYRNASQILATTCTEEFKEILECLRAFRLTLEDIRKPGGNESDIPKRISFMLRKKCWKETRIKGDLVITKITGFKDKKSTLSSSVEDIGLPVFDNLENLKRQGFHVDQIKRENFLDGHKVDYMKNRVAFDVEWNSKDQTFDRDLYAFRAFHECDLIDVAILLTRSASLNAVFHELGAEIDRQGNSIMDKKGNPKLIKSKYGASTTWMGKLLYRLNAGRHGGCPVLALGITPSLITDWKTYDR